MKTFRIRYLLYCKNVLYSGEKEDLIEAETKEEAKQKFLQEHKKDHLMIIWLSEL